MIVVVGLGRETRELLQVLARSRPGAEVVLVDEHEVSTDQLPACASLRLSVSIVDLDRPGAVPLEAEAVYRSPGVSPYRPALAASRPLAPMTTPTGYWASQRDNDDVIAVTGTKGKSTTAALTAHLLTAAGRTVSLRGNIGRPALLADEPDPEPEDVVLELSSYQLTDLPARLALAGMTTLLRDHVPWHGSVERYHADKLRLLELADTTIVTPEVAEVLAGRGSGATPWPPRGVHVDAVTASLLAAAARSPLAAAGLLGEHLVTDALLALALVDARLGLPGGVADLVEALASFRPLPHRLTPVGDHAGVRFVDDSISTVPESAVAAVRAYRPRGPVTVLLGGDERDQDLTPLVALLEDPEVRAVLLPPLAARLHEILAPVAGERIEVADGMADAVERAARLTPRGGSVVLSPAAPSFSSYRDFAARGEHFAALVAALD